MRGQDTDALTEAEPALDEGSGGPYRYRRRSRPGGGVAIGIGICERI